MEKPPLSFTISDTGRRALRWIRTEWRFHVVASVLIAVLSLWWDWHADRAEYFARAGALLTIAGGLMTFRGYLRGVQDAYSRDTGKADQPAFKSMHPLDAKMAAPREDYKAMKWGIIFVVGGTLIWAYGDLAIKRLGICHN